jgi:hypothetical protein
LGARESFAEAANGDPLTLGQANAATVKTSLSTSGTISNDGAFVVDAPQADWAIIGTSTKIGVEGGGFIGVQGYGVFGGYFSGDRAAISLEPQTFAGPPTSNAYTKGDTLVDANGVLWMCIASGTPGTWIKISHGGYRALDAPVRAYDSRSTAEGKLGAPGQTGKTNNPRVLQIVPAVSGVPAQAVAVSGNLAITQGDGAGFATIWPEGAWPGTANINFTSADISNSFICRLSGSGSVSVASSATAHVVIDIAGYIL